MTLLDLPHGKTQTMNLKNSTQRIEPHGRTPTRLGTVEHGEKNDLQTAPTRQAKKGGGGRTGTPGVRPTHL